ncbi:acid phosphatase [Acrasis kona]|uniref:Acid phosphatase n=1 Tax=Acrasis kona TaxID=1008807 RepID=A0AAW2Z547_9EUKA
MNFQTLIGVVLVLSIHATCSYVKGRWFDRIFIVFFENQAYSQTIKDPTFKAVAEMGTLMNNFYGLTHPSQPNYLGTIAGNYWHRHIDLDVDLDYTTVVDLLEAKNITWKSYQEDYPGGVNNCFKGSQYPYMRKHNPFMSFKNIRETKRCDNIVNAKELEEDIKKKSLPQYMFYTPNMLNNAHDTGLKGASSFLGPFIQNLHSNEHFMNNTLVVLTFDEDDYYHITNRVYTVVIGPMVGKNQIDENQYNLYSILKTVEDNWNLGSLGRREEHVNAFSFKNKTRY